MSDKEKREDRRRILAGALVLGMVAATGCGALGQQAETVSEADAAEAKIASQEDATEAQNAVEADLEAAQAALEEADWVQLISVGDMLETGLPEFELFMKSDQTMGRVEKKGESLLFPMEGNEDELEDYHVACNYFDVTGDGVKELLVYENSAYDENRIWKNGEKITFFEDHTIVIDIENMRQIEVESLEEIEEIPEELPVTIVECLEETFFVTDDGTEEECSLYAFCTEKEECYGYFYSTEQYAPGDRVELKLTAIYGGDMGYSYGASATYGEDAQVVGNSCIRLQIPCYYDEKSRTLRYQVEKASEEPENRSYVYEAMQNPGQVVEVETYGEEEIREYHYEQGKTSAVNNCFGTEWYYAVTGQRELYQVTYPDSRDKSAVCLVTLEDGKGYLYVYLEGLSFQEEGEWKYFWQAKEVAYTKKLPKSLS